ncbi:MAG: 2-oxoacid:acceptor oxidoreductase family protein, partial [Pseudomonadota bacterium]|nr:2-oxoacid:acceptor oxidoreductase family protein [Pseudomonadota bacterium]
MSSASHSFSIAIAGSGGSGSVTTGTILLEALAATGYYGLMTRTSGPQIRGGESAVMLRFSDREVHSAGDSFDLLLAFDWLKIDRFQDELPLTEESVILGDSAAGEVPRQIAGGGAKVVDAPLQDIAKAVNGGRANMVGLGVVGGWLDLAPEILRQAVQRVLAGKGEAVVAASVACIEQGRALETPFAREFDLQPAPGSGRWNISGNEACGLGALQGGVRFVAAYPITPASEMLEWLAPRLEQLGGSLLQAEDELASINMIIGGSFGGVPSLTATSGPGLSLMVEALGLAVASETPVVVVNVMRGGPSTGIPTKSEQADLNLALYGLHGDAPHLVLAPLDIKDSVFTTQWAVCLSERLQATAIVLSDQALAQARAVIDPPVPEAIPCERLKAGAPGDDYFRYLLTDDGVSPMSVPGIAGGMYTADGLEHNQHGTPSSMAADHVAQSAKRLDKLLTFDYGDRWAE